MSFKGEIEACCPTGCEPFTTEVWSFIRGDRSPELRNAVLWRECNLLLCDGCGKAFFPEASYVYFEPKAELLAFVFPESYREREAYWRGKMDEDFVTMQKTLGGEMTPIERPLLFFGHEELAEVLENEDYQGEECEVMEHFAKELGLSLYRVSPSYARRERVPRLLPYSGASATRKSVVAGLERLLSVNDRLTFFGDYLSRLKNDPKMALALAAPGRA